MIHRRRVAALALLTMLTMLAGVAGPSVPVALAAPDSEAAARQYRVARRLIAEGSPEAEAALERVLELDPRGPLADDALVDRAVLLGAVGWPSDLGNLDATRARHAARLLDQAIARHAGGDRIQEAHLRRAMLRLEPLGGRDPDAARVALLDLAGRDGGPWPARARYVTAWLDEHEGRGARAEATYQRLVVDDVDPPAAARASHGLARLELRAGRPGVAAGWAQRAIEAGVVADDVRELAVRSLLQRRGLGGEWRPGAGRRVETGVRAPAGMARLPGGGLLLADRRNAQVVVYDGRGKEAGRWPIDGPQAVAVDGFGRGFVAAGTSIFRVGTRGPIPLAELGRYAPVSSLVADSAGTLWLSDRKGMRVGRLAPGAPAPDDHWQAGEVRASLLAWDGARLLGLDARTGRVFTIDERGEVRSVPASGAGRFERPVAVATDAAGRLAVLDSRRGLVVLIGGDGSVLQRFSTSAVGVSRPVAMTLGPDGSLDLLDGANGAWTRVP